MTQPVRSANPTTTERAFQQLRLQILTGALAPGTILRDSDVAEDLGCSRTPVREAIKTLQQLGAIEITPSRVTQVAAINLADLELLEPPIVALLELLIPDVADNLTDADHQQLTEINDRLRHHASESDWPAALEANWHFHSLLFERATNRYLADALTNLMFHSERIGAIRFYAAPHMVDELADEHDQIIEALRSQRAERAAELLIHHARVHRP